MGPSNTVVPEESTFCSEYTPHPRLFPYVRGYLFFSVASGGFHFPADGCPGFVINLGPPFLLGFEVDRMVSIKGYRLFGASTRHLVTHHAAGRTELLAVKFRPGQLPRFFNFPADELTDSSASLQALCGKLGREMESQLSRTDQIPTLIDLLDQSLITCLARKAARTVDQRMLAALDIISSRRGNLRIDALAGGLNLSRRQFERRFRKTVGLTPKRMCRVARFLGLFSSPRAAKTPLNWADLALASGYSDQAHLVRECKYFTGHSPLSYLKSRSAIEHTVMGAGSCANRRAN